MLPRNWMLWACCVGLFAPRVSAGAEAKKPVYPIYAIVSGQVEPTREDLEVLARNFTLAQSRFTKEEIATLHEINPDFKAVVYINSTYTSGPEDAPLAEGKYRKSLLYFRAATLGQDIDEKADRFALAAVNEDGSIALKPSTIPGETSSGPDRPSTKFYVTWIRIGDECMRIEAFDPGKKEIQVTRGFGGTAAAAHKKGATVLSPVYLGSANSTGAYPGGPGRNLRYGFDPANPDGAQRCVEKALEFMGEGADGLWLDILAADPFNQADANGRRVRPWDLRTDKAYDSDAFREGQEIKVRTIQNSVHEKLGKWPFLVANNMKAKSYAEGNGGESLLLMPTKVKPRPLDGYCIEDFVGAVSGRATREQEARGPTPVDEEKWRGNVSMLMAAAQSRLAAYPIITDAGIQSKLIEGLGPVRDRYEQFAYCTYLMGVEKDPTTRLGFPAFYQEGERRFAQVHSRYYWPIGAPAESAKPEELDRYRVKDHLSYSRKFENGVVFANPADKDDQEIQLDQEYTDPETGAKTQSVGLAAHSGKILLRNPETN
ncbi:MAG: hypothetical protein NTW86_26200 [Candidatus Sumerlaeota bacterium]|nr:hypothetical protein [Candidatus Sumerlaeota bacterium]